MFDGSLFQRGHFKELQFTKKNDSNTFYMYN